jgi:hypothetical protein
MWFSYNVSGWINTQVIKAASLEEVVENAFPESYGFAKITEEARLLIEQSWQKTNTSLGDSGEVTVAWDGSPKIVDCGTDERIGSYPYEIEIGVRKGEYNHEGNFVAYRRYLGGLNRLSDNQFHNFDFHEDAIVFAQRWIN